MVIEHLLEVAGRVLRAGIGVVYQLHVGTGRAAAERHPQGVQHEAGAHAGGQLPADDPAAVGVQHEAKYETPCQLRRYVKSATHNASGRQAAKRRWTRSAAAPRRVGRRGADPLAAPLGAFDAVCAHQPPHPVATHPVPVASQRQPDPPRPVGVPVALMQQLDLAQQPLVLDAAPRPLTAAALVVGALRHAQGPADRLDAEAITMRVDERAHFGRSASSSVAKNTDAAFRISFARRSS